MLTSANLRGITEGYAIYIWQCDRDGNYSLYSSGVRDENYLGGVQKTDANGQCTFTTIFPACYEGRWPHTHFEVYPSLDTATSYTKRTLTSQMAMPEDTSATPSTPTATARAWRDCRRSRSPPTASSVTTPIPK